MDFRDGQDCPGIFIVESGLVRVFKSAPNGREHVLHMVSPGQTFAEVAAIGNFPLPANATAAQASTCVLLPARPLQISPDRRPPAVPADAHRHVVLGAALCAVDGRHRIARRGRAGGAVPAEPGANGERELSLPGLKKDLASHLNLTSETLSRVLRRLDEQGMIASKKGGKLRLMDAAGLRAMVEGDAE